MNRVSKIAISVTMCMVIIFIILTLYSYILSKNEAIRLVGETYQYFPLKESSIAMLPVDRTRVGWYFRFLHFQTTEDFEIFTNLKGQIVKIFPRKNLAEIFREYEEREIHPYSKEGLKELYGPVDRSN